MRDLKNTFWSVDQAGLALVFYSMKKKRDSHYVPSLGLNRYPFFVNH
jgi:hypothetical protein